MKSDSEGPAELQAFAEEVLSNAARRAEIVLSRLRFVVATLFAVRLLWIMVSEPDATMPDRAAIALTVNALALAFSAWVLVRLRRVNAPRWLSNASVLFDAAFCFGGLASNVLEPFPSYQGVLHLPETVGILAMMIAAGYRVTLAAAALGTLANGSALLLLLALDWALNRPLIAYRAHHVVLYAILFGGIAALTLAAAHRTRRLVVESANKDWRVDYAERNLRALLQEHHDAATVLTAAMFSASKLRNSVGDSAALEALSRDLAALQAVVEEIKERAYDDSLAIDEPVEVEIEPAIATSKDLIERAAEPTRVEWCVEAPSARVRLPGGAAALRRVLLNLVVNAKQGDGKRGAHRARVAIFRRESTLCLSVEDDGPGFSVAPVPGSSSKPSGTGSGLRLVHALASASGGQVSFAPRDPCGTRVNLLLPLA